MNEQITVDSRASKEYFFRIGLAILVLRVLNTGIQYGVQLVIKGISPELYLSLVEGPWFLWVLSLAPLYLIALPAFYLILPKKPVKYKPAKLKFGNAVGSCVSCIPLMYVGNIIGLLFVALLSILLGRPIDNGLTSMIDSSPVWVVVLCAVVIGPIGEEFIFRKLIIDRLAPFGEARAILFSGLVFGLFHGNFNQFFYTFMLGCALAFAYVKTKNLLAPIIMHMFFNLLGGVIAPYVASPEIMEALELALENPSAMDLGSLITILPAFLFSFFMGATFMAGIALIIVKSILIAKRKFPAPEIVVEGGASRALWGNVAVIVAMVVMAVNFIFYLI